MPLGTILLIVTILSCILIILLTPFVKKISDKRGFWISIGLFVFLYVFFGRQIQYLIPELNKNFVNINDPYNTSLQLSRLLLLDLCPFFAIFGPISLMFKNKTWAKVMAPFGIFGAAVTIFGQIIYEANDILPTQVWDYIFVGIGNNQLYFMMHYLSINLGMMILCWMKNWKWKEFLYCHGFALFYFSYVLIIVSVVPEIKSNTTGIIKWDWLPGGEYDGVSKFLNIKTYPEVMIVGYVLSYISISIIFLLRYYSTKLILKIKPLIIARTIKVLNKKIISKIFY